MTYDRGPVVHYLVYRGYDEDDDQYDFAIKHDQDRCPFSVVNYDRIFWECGLGWQVHDMGADAFGVWDNALRSLKPGTYVIYDWYRTYPGGPWGPTEYDAGIDIGDRVA